MSKLVVIGNGPSLKGFDFDKLNSIDTVGMNAAYRYWDQIGWYPTIYVCMDDKVTQTHHANIKRLIDEGLIKKFFLTRFMLDYYPELKYDSRIYFLEQFNEKYKSLAKKYSLNLIESDYFKSASPAKITTGSSAVRFGCFLGYKEISIIGVDLEYIDIKDGITNEAGIELKVTKKIENNPNYFFDGYQDVGDSFNVPNPTHLGDLHYDVFVILARDSKRFFWPISIFNSNEKSKLYQNNVFPYCDLDKFISEEAFTELPLFNKVKLSELKVLVIDPTHINHQSATGQIKSLFFSGMPPGNIAQICVKFDDSTISGAIGLDDISNNRFNAIACVEDAVTFAMKFSPDVIYFRPIDSVKLFDVAFYLKIEHGIPLVTHFMDDWVLRYKSNRYSDFKVWESKIQKLVQLSDVKIAISNKMADSYKFRYGGFWEVLANGISHLNFGANNQSDKKEDKFVVRYMGGVADDMNFQSVVDFAYTIEKDESLSKEVIFEIYTMPWYIEKLTKSLGKFKSCKIQKLVDDSKYKELIKSSDALLIAYNFDESTQKYVSLSMANKMPECLASGVPVIAFGPSGIATIEFLRKYGLASIVDKRSSPLIKKSLIEVFSANPEVSTRTIRAQHFSLHSLSYSLVIEKFNNYLLSSQCGKSEPHNSVGFTGSILDIEQILLEQELNLNFANECLKNGLNLKALYIYYKLYLNCDFMSGFLAFNIHLCLRRLGFKGLDISVLESRFI